MLKKSNLFIVFAIICVLFTGIINNVHAVSASASATSIYIGESSTITINGSGYAGRYDVSNSNTSVASISQTSMFIDDKSASFTVQAKAEGTTTIKITPTDVASLDDPEKKDSASKSITITVKKKVDTTTNNNQNTDNNTNNATNNENNNTTNNENNNNNNTTNSNNNTTNNSTNTNNATTTTKSSNSYLSKLQVNVEGLSPSFSRGKTNYTLSVGNNVNDIKVTAVAEHSKATVAISGNTGLKTGDNNVYITVTAQNGSKRTYTIVVTKTANPDDSNSYLENLIVENAKLSENFAKEIFEYDCGTVSNDVTSLKILTFPEIEEAKVEIVGNDSLVVGENNIIVKVTSRDSSTVKEYKIKVIKEEKVENPEDEEVSAMVNTSEEELTNSDINNKNNFFENLWYVIKENALIIIMYVLIIVEFIEILYLYFKLNNITIFNKKQKSQSKYNIDITDIEDKIENEKNDDNTNDVVILKYEKNDTDLESKSRRGSKKNIGKNDE